MTIRRKNKYMRGAHEEAFRKQGYSKESLKMLKSKEGQLNAIYACFGSVVAESQLFEDALRRLFTMIPGESPPSDKPNLKRLIDRLRTPIEDEWIWEAFDKAREVRNRVVHRYFVDNQHRLKTKVGRMVMLMELAEISVSVGKIKDLVNGMCVAVTRTFENKENLDDLDEAVTYSFSFPEEVKNGYLRPFQSKHLNE